ncbi:MAG: biotin carboxyl carrier protein [Actinophytocola sp.]|nr:biotin carboxyl carrier protein [Actinophytocola sp.]
MSAGDVSGMRQIKFVDTTIRDGQASLWAMNMRTSHMLPAMPHLDAAGFDSMEFIATGSRLKKFVRHLKENPWDWINKGAEVATRTPLRWHGPIDGPSMSGQVPPEVGELLIAKAAERGIRYTRTGNNWNDFSSMGFQLDRFARLGMTPVVNLMYSVSPRHTDEYFVTKAKQVAMLRPFRLCFKDVGGLLTPERARELLPKVMRAAGDIPWEFHGHCTNGLGPLNAIEAVRAGMEYVHTAVPPLANANSQPSVYSLARNLRELGYDAAVDEEVLRPATAHFEFIAKRERFQIGAPYEYDERLYRHQVPGGMISNLRYQLRQAGAADRLDEVLEETARVRAEFGYPIMVTPLSQIVGSQAAINVIVGERYGQVTDRAIDYALGRHGGDEALDAMDPDVRDRILDRPRARELAIERPPPPTLAELRQRYGHGVSDEDLILMAIVGDDAIDVVGRANDVRTQVATDRPLVQLIRELAERDHHRFVSIRRDGFSLTMRKGVSHGTHP